MVVAVVFAIACLKLNPRFVIRFSFIVTLFFIVPVSYTQDFQGSLAGVVMDSSGGSIPDADIVLQSTASSLERQTKSDNRGEFRFSDLLPGVYKVTVRATGLAEASSTVTITVSFAREIMVTLQPAASQQTVNVEGAASSIVTQPMDTSSAVHGGVVTARDLETIPLAMRSFANIAYLIPGTEPVEPSDPTKARITAVSFGGSSGLNDVLSVDGGDNSDDYIGGFLQNFSTDALQEFAVQTSQQDADTGRTVGGSVVITTKRGTNLWHGEAAIYERAAALDARYPIENPAPLPKQPFSRQNYIGTIGGPIVKDKLWFFASFEGVHEDASIAYSPASLTQFQALSTLASQGLIPGITSIAVPDNVLSTIPRLPGRSALRLGAVVSFAMVPAHFGRQLHHRQCVRGAGHASIHRRDIAFELLERGARPTIHFRSCVVGNSNARCQRLALERVAQLGSGICACLPVQLHVANHFRLRDFR